MTLHRECTAGVHLQRPSVIRAGGNRAGRPWPWGPPGPSGCCVGGVDFSGLCARRSGLSFWCLESLFQASFLAACPFFFFSSRNRQRCTPGWSFATSSPQEQHGAWGSGLEPWRLCPFVLLLFFSKSCTDGNWGQLCPLTPVPVE